MVDPRATGDRVGGVKVIRPSQRVARSHPPGLSPVLPGGVTVSTNGYPQAVETFVIIMLILGFVCFAAATLGVASRFNLIAAGLAFWILSVLVPALDAAL